MPHTKSATNAFSALLEQRIVIFDGAMGTMIQRHRCSEAQFRGERFKDWRSDLRGNNDLLSLTQPDIIAEIHRAYLDAGADVISTNTFNSTSVSQADYGMQELVGELKRKKLRLSSSILKDLIRQELKEQEHKCNRTIADETGDQIKWGAIVSEGDQ